MLLESEHAAMPSTNRHAWDKSARNLQPVKNAVKAKYSKAKCQKNEVREC